MEIISSGQSILWANAYTFSAGNLQIQQGDTVNLGGASLIMQGDGNLVLYQNGTPLWNSGTMGQNCGINQCHAVFQADGNFVVYNGSTPIWSSGTAGNTGAELAQLGEPEILGTLMPAYPAKECVYLNGQILAVEND